MAKVQSVSEPSITTIESARENREQQSFVEVVSAPVQSDNGNYVWSTGQNEMAPMVGMPAIARVTLKERAPIAFVFPFLEQPL